VTDEASGDEGSGVPVPGRLRWRCRRGTKELDLLLAAYLDRRYPNASPRERAAFERLTEWPDPDIFAALVGRGASSDSDTDAVLSFLRSVLRG
jgi:antitoxin CptB